jgi:hypothetical protein
VPEFAKERRKIGQLVLWLTDWIIPQLMSSLSSNLFLYFSGERGKDNVTFLRVVSLRCQSGTWGDEGLRDELETYDNEDARAEPGYFVTH